MICMKEDKPKLRGAGRKGELTDEQMHALVEPEYFEQIDQVDKLLSATKKALNKSKELLKESGFKPGEASAYLDKQTLSPELDAQREGRKEDRSLSAAAERGATMREALGEQKQIKPTTKSVQWNQKHAKVRLPRSRRMI